MEMNDDKAGLILNAIGLAVIELIGTRMPITKDNLIDKLEHNRREAGNLIGKGTNRYASELVRKET